MSSSSSKAGVKKPQFKVWEDVPVTLTEFGAIDSEEKPKKGFLSRLWKKDKGVYPQSSSRSSSPADDADTTSASPDTGSITTVPDSSIAGSALSSRYGSKTSLADIDSTDENQEIPEDQQQGNALPHRTLSSVLHRLSSILDQRSTTPQAYKDSDFKQYWMPDQSCRECYDCGDKFTTFRRRHHCRICGQIFCSKCCNQELPGKIIGYKGGIRVCTYCCKVVQRYAKHNVISGGDVRALEDLRTMPQMSESGSFDFGSRSMSPHPPIAGDELSPPMRGDQMPDLPGLTTPDLIIPFDLTPQSEFSTEESLLQESRVLIQDSVQLRELWRHIFDVDVGVETQTLRIRLRTYQNCIVGKELVNWLIDKDRAAKRVQAIGIGQALLFAGYLECVGNQPPIFKDDFTLYRPGEITANLDRQRDTEAVPTSTEEMEKNEPLWLQEIEKEEEDDNSMQDYQSISVAESEALKSTSSESDTRTLYYLSETSRSGSFSDNPKFQLLSRDMVEEPLPRQDSSVNGLGDEFLKGGLFLGKSCMPSSDVVTCPHGWRLVEQLREENGEKISYDRLKKAHSEHWHALTRQLLCQSGLLPSWEPVISSCISQITHYVRPDVRLEGDDMDIRSYVHIKKIPGGQKADTNLVHGVIFTKNIAHKKMRTKIANPLILLLRGTIEFQRIEQKFSSLEPQILQEKEFMRNCIMKMIAYRPNVVVVEKSVSRLAQEFLLQAGITLIYNVKMSVMERLARFTQADIVPSIDGLVRKPNMGFCHDFRCQTYNLPNKETKTLAVFDGCATHLGCTVNLTGGSISELRRVKSILKFMSYTSYNSLLELCFCMDEFALPQPGADEMIQSFDDSSGHLAKELSNRTLTSDDQIRSGARPKVKSDDKEFTQCSKSVLPVVLGDSLEELDGQPEQFANGLLPCKSTHCHGDANTQASPTNGEYKDLSGASSEDINVQNKYKAERRRSQSDVTKVYSSSKEALPVFKQNFFSANSDDDAAAAKAQTPTSSVSSFLSVDNYRKRHASAGQPYENALDRSSPDVFVSRSSSRNDCETTHLVGNVICIIPAADDEGHSGGNRKEPGAESKESSTENNHIALPHESSAGTTDGGRFGGQSHDQEGDRLQDSGNISRISSTSSANGNISSSASPSLGKRDSSNRCTTELTELTDFSDPLLGYQNTQDESIFDSGPHSKIALKEIKQTNYKRFRKALDGVHLSISPYHKYNVPFIETDKGLSCNSRQYLPGEIFWSRLFDGELDRKAQKGKGTDTDLNAKQSNRDTFEILSHHPLIMCNLSEPLWEKDTQSLIADFRARGGRIRVTGKSYMMQGSRNGEQKNAHKEDGSGTDGTSSHMLWEKKLDCLDPANHQRLTVLFSSFSFKSNNHPYPCVYPWVVTMEFYGRHDITLGGFLERFCFRKQYACPSPSCDVPMTDHIRRFVHGNACINVLLRKLDNEWPGGKENILMWSWCRKCKQVTPVVPISADTWSLSFAKYLDLRFHSSSLHRRGSAEPCPHSLHHEHFQYFCHRDLVASFKYSTISLKELTLPAPVVSLKPPTFNATQLSNKVSRIAYRATERYSLLFENTMKLKNELTSEAQTKTLSDFIAEQQRDKAQFRDAATNIQMKIQDLIKRVRTALESGDTAETPEGEENVKFTFKLHSIDDNIKLLKRHICEDVIKWNVKIQEFVTSQQRKIKKETNRKDKDAGSADELEKSMKGSWMPSKSTIHSNANPSSAPTSLTETSESQPMSADGEASSLPSQNDCPSVVVSQVEEVTTGVNLTQSAALEGGGQVDSTNAATTATASVSSSGPAAAVGLQTTQMPSTSTSGAGTESSEDTADSWLQDLKGVTRRWLSPISFTPLPVPFDPSEHYTLPLCERLPVVVYDQEPSSIIAYTLSSSYYLQRLKEIQTAAKSVNPDGDNSSLQASYMSSRGDSGSQASGHSDETGRRSGVLSFLRGNLNPLSRDSSSHHSSSSSTRVLDSVHYVPKSDLEDSFSATGDTNYESTLEDSTPSPDERPKTAGSNSTSPHIELQYSDSSARFYCRIYFADSFRKIRKLILPGADNAFIRSLSRCKPWEAKGGKSGSTFCKTDDDRFILKQMSTMEVESFEKFGPQYFSYIKSNQSEQCPTALAKILGVFRIGFRNSQTNTALRQDVLVMENLFYNRKISQKFDLKGSMRNRLVSTAGRRGEEELVLLDENLLKSNVENPLYLRPHSKAVLKAAIASDSAFLSTNLVMDYSLLVGIDDATGEMVVGIIDYIRTFTWDKRLEMVVKSSGILGGQGRMPTVVSPQLYRSRFLEAMDHYFLHVPTPWTGLGIDSVVRHM